ncbi:hypothetical protein POX_f08170 [Penicillium oxalicum]|uniref:hypothetical protein n=1 Tax=Penicillium oxalicum TaxID=69781 RepID=UPI0020B6DE57|nr:hypothetical protein POX_f08170 [Penicillium oxalicum]KAI2787793.1 hypothetical protein POX_f08170 [Penicillium oxalicum]
MPYTRRNKPLIEAKTHRLARYHESTYHAAVHWYQHGASQLRFALDNSSCQKVIGGGKSLQEQRQVTHQAAESARHRDNAQEQAYLGKQRRHELASVDVGLGFCAGCKARPAKLPSPKAHPTPFNVL